MGRLFTEEEVLEVVVDPDEDDDDDDDDDEGATRWTGRSQDGSFRCSITSTSRMADKRKASSVGMVSSCFFCHFRST